MASCSWVESRGKCTWFIPWIYRHFILEGISVTISNMRPHGKELEHAGDNSWRKGVPCICTLGSGTWGWNLLCSAAEAAGRVNDTASSPSSEDLSDVDCTWTKSQITNIIPLTRLLLCTRNFSVVTQQGIFIIKPWDRLPLSHLLCANHCTILKRGCQHYPPLNKSQHAAQRG